MTAVDGVIWETYDEMATELLSKTTVEDFGRALDRQNAALEASS